MNHFIELRKRLFRCLLVVSILFLALFPFAADLYAMLANPLVSRLPGAGHLVAITVSAPIIAPLKLAFIASCGLTMPFIWQQLWGFITPGLYQQERIFTLLLTSLSTLLFYSGCLFAYFVVFPLLFSILIKLTPATVVFMPDMMHYLNFVLRLMFIFGFAFQLPLIVFIAVASQIVTVETLASYRPYMIVGAFILGMLLTPPDVISQILLALPLWGLFEIGLILARVLVPHTQKSNICPKNN